MKVDDHGFPMRDDLDKLKTTKRIAYGDDVFYLDRMRMLRRKKRQSGSKKK